MKTYERPYKTLRYRPRTNPPGAGDKRRSSATDEGARPDPEELPAEVAITAIALAELFAGPYEVGLRVLAAAAQWQSGKREQNGQSEQHDRRGHKLSGAPELDRQPDPGHAQSCYALECRGP